jgi:hypothetical protein
MNRYIGRRGLLAISLMLYVASLVTEAIPESLGLNVLVMGWMEFLALETVGPFVAFAWLANPLLLLGLLLDSFPLQPFGYIARVLLSIALLLSVGYILFGQYIVYDESGSTHLIRLTPGYILWLSSILVGFIRAFLTRRSVAGGAGA